MLCSLALLGSGFFAGWAVGAPLFSSVADNVGRKTLTLSVLPVAVLVGLLPMLPDPGAFLKHVHLPHYAVACAYACMRVCLCLDALIFLARSAGVATGANI